MRHYIYDLDDMIAFGKYEGKTIQEILDCDAQYIHWCIENLNSFALTETAMEEAKAKHPFFYDVEDENAERLENFTAPEFLIENDFEMDYEDAYGNDDEYNDYDHHDCYYEEDIYPEHYGEYAGTYAQDVEGLSDEFIDDVLGGDPDAYWNID